MFFIKYRGRISPPPPLPPTTNPASVFFFFFLVVAVAHPQAKVKVSGLIFTGRFLLCGFNERANVTTSLYLRLQSHFHFATESQKLLLYSLFSSHRGRQIYYLSHARRRSGKVNMAYAYVFSSAFSEATRN